jgi:hypothetical protein
MPLASFFKLLEVPPCGGMTDLQNFTRIKSSAAIKRSLLRRMAHQDDDCHAAFFYSDSSASFRLKPESVLLSQMLVLQR